MAQLGTVIEALNAVMDKIDEVTGRYGRSVMVTCSQFIDDIEKLINIAQYDSSENHTEIAELSNLITDSNVDACTTEDILLLKTHKLTLEVLVSKYSDDYVSLNTTISSSSTSRDSLSTTPRLPITCAVRQGQ